MDGFGDFGRERLGTPADLSPITLSPLDPSLPLEPVPTAIPAPRDALPEPPAEGPAATTLAALEAALEDHRAAVFDAVMTTPQALLAGQLLFECTLLGQGRAGRRPAVDAVADRAREVGFDLYSFELPGEAGVGLVSLLAEPARAPVEMGAAMGALFALGFHAALGQRPLAARRAITARLVAALPALERWSRAQVADYIHLACRPEDDARFWAIYVERVVIEVNARATAPAGPWLLPHLLLREARGIDPVPSAAWGTLKRHVDRLLHAPTGRGRWAQALLEQCQDVDMLHAIAHTPAVVEDPAIMRRLLLDGQPAAVSCAVFALHHGHGATVVADVLAAARERPFPDVVGALAEIHAQVALVPRPGPALVALSEGIVATVGERAAEHSLDALLDTVRPNPRSLRTSLLPVAAAAHPGLARRPQASQLRQRVLSTWLSIFTPAGVSHPLNDQLFRDTMATNLAALLREDDRAWGPVDALQQRLVERATGYAVDVDGRSRLLGRFCGALGDVLRRCDATLAAAGVDDGVRASVHARLVDCWRMDPSAGAGWLGPGERALGALFADLRTPGTPDASRRRAAAAQLLALAPVTAGDASTFGVRPDRPTAPTTTAEPLGRVPPATRRAMDAQAAPAAFDAACLVARVGEGGWLDVLSSYLALPFWREATALVGRVLGWQQSARISLTTHGLVLRHTRRRGGAQREHVVEVPLDAVEGVEVERGMWLFPASLGAAALVAGGLVGGALLYAGLRSESTAWATGGAAVLLGAGGVDAALAALVERRRSHVNVRLVLRDRRRISLWLAPEAGGTLLDELMNRLAERAELAARGSFVAAGVAEQAGWGGDGLGSSPGSAGADRAG